MLILDSFPQAAESEQLIRSSQRNLYFCGKRSENFLNLNTLTIQFGLHFAEISIGVLRVTYVLYMWSNIHGKCDQPQNFDCKSQTKNPLTKILNSAVVFLDLCKIVTRPSLKVRLYNAHH